MCLWEKNCPAYTFKTNMMSWYIKDAPYIPIMIRVYLFEHIGLGKLGKTNSIMIESLQVFSLKYGFISKCKYYSRLCKTRSNV